MAASVSHYAAAKFAVRLCFLLAILKLRHEKKQLAYRSHNAVTED